MKKEANVVGVLMLCVLLMSCSWNPFSTNNHTTGSVAGAAVGAGAGAGGVALLGGSKPMLALGAITGGMFGYYITTLRYDAGPLMKWGGQVYTVGDVVGIYLPSDTLFEPNSADFLPQSTPILDSAAAVLRRYPNNNIIVSGNTSGFYRAGWEQRLSERRAKAISAYLWDAGINDFKDRTTDIRQLNYVGYGDYFPVANMYRNDGIRANSRIQIISYPSDCDLLTDKLKMTMNNVGDLTDQSIYDAPTMNCRKETSDGKCIGVSCMNSMNS